MRVFLKLIYTRIKGLLFKSRLDDELNAELEFHLKMRTQDNIRNGMTEDEAKREARKRFGNLGRIKDESLDVKGGGLLDTVIQDLRYGFRLLHRNPGFTAVAVLTLALGIGADTAIFSIVNGVLLKSLPYPNADRIVQCYWRWTTWSNSALTTTELAFWKQQSRSFEESAAYTSAGSSFNLSSSGEAQRVRGAEVSREFFSVLGVTPNLGRTFSEDEDLPGGQCAAVITDGLWLSGFGGARDVVGRQAELNGQSCSIVGVLPKSFQFQPNVDIFIPIRLSPNSADPSDRGHNTTMIARLKPGVTEAQAQAEMDLLYPRFTLAYPGHAGANELGVLLVPYQRAVVGDTSSTILILMGAVALVLLIACANLANLIMARGSSRRGEMAIRVALGAGRRRLIRQLMTESLLLAFVGGLLGLLGAYWILPILLSLSPPGLPRVAEIGLDKHVLLFALAASAGTSLIFGIIPALQTSRIETGISLKSTAGRTANRGLNKRVRQLLIVVEVSLSVVLLTGAALLVQSFINMQRVDLGFNTENLRTVQVSLNSANYQTAAQTWELEKRVIDKLSTIPGVTSVATVPSLPLERGLNGNITIKDRPDAQHRLVECRFISPSYFQTLGISVLRGRGFDDSDRAGSEYSVVINDDLAKRLWPGKDPVGETFELENENRRVVGVVRNIREKGPDQPVSPTVYIPQSQVPDGMTGAVNTWFLTTWLIRTSSNTDIDSAVRSTLKEVDPKLPIANIRTMSDVMVASLSWSHFITTLITVFAAFAILLTVVGLYGVLSYEVSSRSHELGIRLALGAAGKNIFSLVVGQGVGLSLVGVFIGGLAAIGLTRLLSGFLFGVTAKDPFTFFSICVLVVGVATLACLVPALRAMRIDPLTALRED